MVLLCMLKIYLPAYRRFECLAGNCPENCCKVFRILFFNWEREQFATKPAWQDADGNGVPLTKYLNYNGGECLLAKDEEGQCPFFTNKSLCDLQLRNGIGALPSVCRTYPRLITRFPDRTEYALDTCCFHVLQLVRDWNPGDLEIVGGEAPSDEAWLVRKQAMELLSERSLNLNGIMKEIGGLYGFQWRSQNLHFDEPQEEFLRKAISATIWAYALPYLGHHKYPKPMIAIMEFLTEYLDHLSGLKINGWDYLSADFSRRFSSYVKEVKFDDDMENRYVDLLDD